MRVSEIRRYIAAWTACFAVLMASLAPSISHFIAAPTFASTQTVESSVTLASNHQHHMGMGHHVSVDATDNAEPSLAHGSGSHPPSLHFEHCPFCFTHAGSFGLPLHVFLPLPAVKSALTLPVLFYLWPGRPFAWTPAQARAPPTDI